MEYEDRIIELYEKFDRFLDKIFIPILIIITSYFAFSVLWAVL